MGFFWKLLLLLLFGPALLAIAAQLWWALVVAVLPWLIVLAILMGVVAGLTAGFVIARRLPPRPDGHLLPPQAPALGPWRVRRPRGGGYGR